MAQVSIRLAVLFAGLTGACMAGAQQQHPEESFAPVLAAAADFRNVERRDFVRPITPKHKSDSVLGVEYSCGPAEKYPIGGLPLLAVTIERLENERIKTGEPFDVSVAIVNPCDTEIWIPWTVSPGEVEEPYAPYSFYLLRLELDADLGPRQAGHETVIHASDLLTLYASSAASFTQFRLGPREFVRVKMRFQIPQPDELLASNLPRIIKLSVRGYAGMRSVDADGTYVHLGWYPLQGTSRAASVPARLEQK